MIHTLFSSLSVRRRVPQAKPRRRLSPGLSWSTAVQNTLRFSRKTLDFLLHMRERYGDVVTVPTLFDRIIGDH